MGYEIMFAHADSEEELRGIFLDSNMDIAGDIQEHVLIKKDDEIIGGGMLAQTGKDAFHLLVLAVKESARKFGIGRLLLEELIKHPWLYCLGSSMTIDNSYRITTVAKGESAGFYRKYGFYACGFSELTDPFCGQCRECPDMSDCNPVAMMYTGSTSKVLLRRTLCE